MVIRANITYFRETGKYYTSEDNVALQCEHSFELPEAVRKLRDQKKLPGLASGSWHGPILIVERVSRLPYLVLPDSGV